MAALLVFGAFATYSVLVWLGRPAVIRTALPGWIDDDGLLGLQARAITISGIWFAGGFILLFGAAFTERLLGIRPSYVYAVNPIDLLLLAPGIALFVLGYASAGWMRPRWAVPAWFRKDLHRGRYGPVHKIAPEPTAGLWRRAWRARIPHRVVYAALMLGGSVWTGEYQCVRAGGDVSGCQSVVEAAWIAGIVGGILTAALGLPLGWFTSRSGPEGAALEKRNLRLARGSNTVAWIIIGAGGLLALVRWGFVAGVTGSLAWLGVVTLVLVFDWARVERRPPG